MKELPDFPCERPTGWRDRWRVWRAGVDGRKSLDAIAVIAGTPICAFVGGNGGGKTLAAVYAVLPTLAGQRWDCANPDHLHTHGTDCAARRLLSTEPTAVCDCPTQWETAEQGRVVTELADGGIVTGWRRVLSTVELRDVDDPLRVSPYYDRLRSFVQLLAVEHTDVLMDEVTGVASSRSSMSLPVQVENLVQQLRRRDARLLWTTPDYGNADVRIRSVTRGVVLCRGRFAVEKRGVWAQARLFRWTMFDASEFDRFTVGRRERLVPVARQTFWRPGHIAQQVYDTAAAVTQLGAAAEGGMCLSCGGRRSAPSCTCPPDPDRLPPGVVETITATGGRRRRFELHPVDGDGAATA
ncbi:hypothetical protein [Cellulomonas sp. RIT-PI-Y]|uniref:hypothetical protein n=1 Tax=Cellulomonas sp. RIT-PI-Y TaxID=3035297 RepID=UPI0021D9601E|nr:hypothetical protein [Cellulomonas sp. RIT-PI-Y]